MVVIKLGPLKDKSGDIVAFLEGKVGVKPELDGDTITFKADEDVGSPTKRPPTTGLVKTYVKRYLHREGLRKRYRILREKGVCNIVELETKEEEES